MGIERGRREEREEGEEEEEGQGALMMAVVGGWQRRVPHEWVPRFKLLGVTEPIFVL